MPELFMPLQWEGGDQGGHNNGYWGGMLCDLLFFIR